LSPYGKEIQSLPVPPQPPTSPVYSREIEAGDPRYLTGAAYVHLVVDVRGTGKSGGVYRGWMSEDEGRDSYDVIEWAAEQEWSNGKVGMVGVSYYGAIELAAAAPEPPGRLLPRGVVSRWYAAHVLRPHLQKLRPRAGRVGGGGQQLGGRARGADRGPDRKPGPLDVSGSVQ